MKDFSISVDLILWNEYLFILFIDGLALDFALGALTVVNEDMILYWDFFVYIIVIAFGKESLFWKIKFWDWPWLTIFVWIWWCHGKAGGGILYGLCPFDSCGVVKREWDPDFGDLSLWWFNRTKKREGVVVCFSLWWFLEESYLVLFEFLYFILRGIVLSSFLFNNWSKLIQFCFKLHVFIEIIFARKSKSLPLFSPLYDIWPWLNPFTCVMYTSGNHGICGDSICNFILVNIQYDVVFFWGSSPLLGSGHLRLNINS